MKTLALMFVIGSVYAALGNVVRELMYGVPLDGDTKFAFFLMGAGVAVFIAKKLEWLW